MSTFQLYRGDCLDILPLLDEGSVDAIVTDPPYGDTSLAWDKRSHGWASASLRLLRPGGSMWVFGSFRYFADSFASNAFAGWKIAQDIVWEKHNGSSFHADRFKRVHELAVQFYPDGQTWRDTYKRPQYTLDATKKTVRRKKRPPHTGQIGAGHYVSEDGGPKLMRSVIYARSCHGFAVHPTQKPEDIVTPLLEFSAAPGANVFDPFMGSGSTGVACANTGRNFIGIELDPTYFAAAKARVEAAYAQQLVGVFG